MKINLFPFTLSLFISLHLFAQDQVTSYSKKEVMIPMRDGINLFTIVRAPANSTKSVPILLIRSPYGANNLDDHKFIEWAYVAGMAAEGYIFVIQDIRGKYKSKGAMQIHQPLIHATQKNAVDESTDTWDTIDWLIKNVPGNNGNAGIFGISYPGWLALVGAVDPHPALKAASEQACMGDLFLGDDFHHNGAFRLSYGLQYSYGVEFDKTTGSNFPFPQYDLYDWYLNLGSLKNVNEKYCYFLSPSLRHFCI